MPIFAQAVAAVGYIQHCVTLALSMPFVAMRQTVATVKQSEATVYTYRISAQEEKNITKLSTKCNVLTKQQKSENMQYTKILQSLNASLSYNDAIVLVAHDDDLLPIEHKVHEYLAVTRVLNVTQNRSETSLLLHEALRTIICASPVLSATECDEHTLSNVCTLIEHIMLDRIPALRSMLPYDLRQYVDIDETLQLLCILQERLNSLSNNTIVQCIHTNIANVQTKTHIVGYFAEVDNDDKKIDVSQITNTYATNLQTLVYHYALIIGGSLKAKSPIVHDNITLMSYSAIVTTQVFAAMATRRSLYYEMQRHFHRKHTLLINTVVHYAHDYNLPGAQQHSPSRMVEQLMQMRIAQMLQTYYAYHILEEFINCALALQTKDLSTKMCIKLRTRAKVAISLIEPNLLNPTTTEIAIQFTEYIYALALMYVVNYGGNIAVVRAINNETKAMFADAAIQNVIYRTNIIGSVLSSTTVWENYDIPEISAILNATNPLSAQHGEQVVQYLRSQAIQLLNYLPDALFGLINESVLQDLTSACHNQLRAQAVACVSVHIPPLEISGSLNNFRIAYVRHNTLSIVNLIRQHLETRQANPHVMMGFVVSYLLLDIEQNSVQKRIIDASIITNHAHNTRLSYMLINTLIYRIRDHNMRYVMRYSTCLVVAGVMLYVKKTKCWLYPFQMAQGIAQRILHN